MMGKAADITGAAWGRFSGEEQPQRSRGGHRGGDPPVR
jgi:hypothetical protein